MIGPAAERRRVPVAALTTIAAAAGLVVGAVVVQGYDAQDTVREETSVWVARDDGRYARFDTELDQIDTVRAVDDPSAVLQDGSQTVMLTQGMRTVWQLDPASPADLTAGQEGTDGSAATPEGTSAVVASAGRVLYLTDLGAVWVAELGSPGSAARIDPEPGASPDSHTPYVATVATIDPDGQVATYSAEEQAVRVIDSTTGDLVDGPATLSPAPDPKHELQISLVNDQWVLLDAEADRLWTGGRSVALDLGPGALLEQSGGTGTTVYVADEDGLVGVDMHAGRATRVVPAAGAPARPVPLSDGVVVAAWLGADGGALWTSDKNGTRSLSIIDDELRSSDRLNPVIADNGDRAVLEETGTGAMWTVPDGRAISVDQWTPIDEETTDIGTKKVDEVTEEMAPVAVADTFGVRAGAWVRLPVLLNDHDPNATDVLTIDPGSLADLPSEFGSIELTDNNQLIVAHISAASGAASFSYAVTDGEMASEPVTVTLHVADETTSSAPVWCGVDQCVQTWPTPSLAPGGTVRVRVLDDWVDPDGDPFVLTQATVDDPSAPLQVVASADGTLTIHHTDPNGVPSAITATVVVTDSKGQATTRALTVSVIAAPELELEPVALIAGRDTAATVAVADHVRSGSGSYRLVDAVASASSAQRISTSVNPVDGTVSVTPHEPGEYQVTYTVHDEVTGAEKSALIRVVCPDGGSGITVTPMTAFVRDHQDTTIDVLSAVQSTSGHVLVLAEATSADPGLGVDVVDGSLLRLRGTTSDGQPGLVGTVTITVSDGGSLSATSTIAVFLVPTVYAPPIAVPDTAVVRAGGQVDIPVTANDVAPGDADLVVDEAVVGSGAPGELAFASRGSVRYVAPRAAGTYRLEYSVWVAGNASDVATSSVTVTVVPDGTNRAPAPPVLTARVGAGHQVEIPFDPVGLDPDGDTVDLVSVTQPSASRGATSVNDTGTAITFEAPASLAPGNQVTFTYTVRDPDGAEGTGTARVAVTAAADGEGAPIAYTDRVRLQQGDPEPAVLEPLLNDRDPASGTLSVVSVRPDAPNSTGNPEWERLEGLLDLSDSDDGRVIVTAGDELGVHAYVYTVQSSVTGSTSEGLIVVEVVADGAADRPVVLDTVLTAAERADLSRNGIDVVSGKVTWPAGDVAGLSLSVWGSAADRYTVKGNRIIGMLPAKGDLVPFMLTGHDRNGETVVAYGFLRIPSYDAMRVSPDLEADPVQVDESSSVTFSVADYVDLASGDTLQVADAAHFQVQRAEASCSPTSGTKAVYAAGNGAPWNDTCVVRVRLAGQSTWTDLVVPVKIAPQAPQAVLTSLSRTIAPGGSETIDLLSMTSWEGGRAGDEKDLVYVTSVSSPSFTMSQQGQSVTVQASARAVPGSRATVSVSISAFGGLRSTIELVVGQAAVDAPKGATVAASCDVSRGGCSVPVVGVAGEYDPFAGKPDSGLSLGEVGAYSCQSATITASDTRSVQVTWPQGAKPSGGSCQVPFTVVDAQGRTGPGLLQLDVLGYPPAPASLTQSGYTATSVTLDIALGQAANAHPAVTDVSIYEGGHKVGASCSPSGASAYRCVVSGLVNGQQHTYTARVRSSVGESDPTTPVTAWAYKTPSASDLEVVSEYRAGHTTGTTGSVHGSVTVDDDVDQILVNGTPVSASRVAHHWEFDVDLPVGPTTVSVTPVSRFTPPIGATDNSGSALTAGVTVVGSPIVQTAPTVQVSGTEATISGAAIDANYAPSGYTATYVLSTSGTATCESTLDGDLRVSGPGIVAEQASPTFSGLSNNTRYYATICVTNGYGASGAATSPASFGVFTSGPPTGTATYGVSVDATKKASTYTYGLVVVPDLQVDRGNVLKYSFGGGDFQEIRFADWPGWASHQAPGTILAEQCSRALDVCSAPVTVTVASGYAAATASVSADHVCIQPDGSPTPQVLPFTESPSGMSTVTGPVLDSDTAPSTVTWTLTWTTAPYSTLNPITYVDNTYEACAG